MPCAAEGWDVARRCRVWPAVSGAIAIAWSIHHNSGERELERVAEALTRELQKPKAPKPVQFDFSDEDLDAITIQSVEWDGRTHSAAVSIKERFQADASGAGV